MNFRQTMRNTRLDFKAYCPIRRGHLAGYSFSYIPLPPLISISSREEISRDPNRA